MAEATLYLGKPETFPVLSELAAVRQLSGGHPSWEEQVGPGLGHWPPEVAHTPFTH